MEFKLNLAGKELKVEIRNLAEQANADILIRMGDTILLTTCVMSEEERKGLSFFPLTVNYEEKYYAAGKIKGSRFVKRETYPSDEAICTSRLIDRAIRPRFSDNFQREVQVIATVLSWDEVNDPDILALLSASLGLSISDIPWRGPIAAVRVVKINGNLVLNPSYKKREESEMDFIIAAGEEKGELLINMMEGNFKEVGGKSLLEAIDFAKKYLKELIDFQKKISEKIGEEKILIEIPKKDLELEKEIKNFLGNELKGILDRKMDSNKKRDALNKLKEGLAEFVEKKYPMEKYPEENKLKYAQDFFEEKIKHIVRINILQNEKRPDGRGLDEIRPLHCEVGILPRAHGSALFCRGQTKSLSVLTLGSPEDVQLIDQMEIEGKKRFMHHYNFPPYSVGEVQRLGRPGRREIGHGKLVEKALLPLLPSFEEFPYAIRMVSEILSSNGSTSMASISSSCLALMDGGIKIKRVAAGIALGLITQEGGDLSLEKNYKILTDIQGPEDHYGDMDLKIAGTERGITVVQLDVKIQGITKEIIEKSLKKAEKARIQIIRKMKKTLPKPREALSRYAPRVLILKIDPEKIRRVIGPGGKTINEIIEKYEVSIDVEPSGLIYITSEKEETAKKAIAWIKNLTQEIKKGEVFQGKVTKILDFGAFVEILPGQEGFLHISELTPGRVKRVEDVIEVGDVIPIKVISIDERGRINLSLKAVKKIRPGERK